MHSSKSLGTAGKLMPIQKSWFAALAASVLIAAPLAYSQSGNAPVDATKLTPTETASRAKQFVSEMEATLKQIEGLQEVARKEKDLVRLDCINEKLVEYRKLLEVTAPADKNLKLAIKDNDNSGRIYNYTTISIAHERAMELSREAETCDGEVLTYAGDTVVEVEIDGEIPDPTEPGFGDHPIDVPTDFTPTQ
jgi:hypothetical protein